MGREAGQGTGHLCSLADVHCPALSLFTRIPSQDSYGFSLQSDFFWGHSVQQKYMTIYWFQTPTEFLLRQVREEMWLDTALSDS